MKKAIFCLMACFLSLPVVALTYSDFPPNVQRILDERAVEIEKNGGICVAGRVKLSDGAHINGGQDVLVDLDGGICESLWVYDDGWFVMGRTFPASNPGQKIVARAFGYAPIDVAVAIPKGQITYVELTMQKTAPEKLASVEGIVTNEPNEPFNGAHVSLSFPFPNHGFFNMPFKDITTDPNGRFRFDGLSSAQCSLSATASDYGYHSVGVTPLAGQTMTVNLKLYRDRKIVIDYVYQPDGSRNLTGGTLKTGTIEWVNGNKGLDFSDGRLEDYERGSEWDIDMRQTQGKLRFHTSYIAGGNINNGFYDAGAVPFDSVVEAAEKRYDYEETPCIAGHVYVVKTYEGNYAKFIVKDIRESTESTIK
jgi:hypothetical protein